MSMIEPIFITSVSDSARHRSRPTASSLRTPDGTAPDPSTALPLPTVRDQVQLRSETYYTVSSIDASGRIADRSPLRELGWSSGTRLAMRLTDTAIIASARPDGAMSVTGQGHLHLPASVRRAFDLRPSDRVLIVVHQDENALIVFAPSTLDVIFGITPSTGVQR